MLKKQTVWLLTMLSLMVVLSVYYILSPTNNNNNLAYLDDGKKAGKDATVDSAADDGSAKVDDITPGKDELFMTLRMDLDDQRSREIARLKEVVAASEASTDEKNKAMDNITEIEQTSMKETALEKTIIAANEYEDVLVRHNGQKVHVQVKTEELSNEEALDIMQMVRDEFGDIKVDVNYQ